MSTDIKYCNPNEYKAHGLGLLHEIPQPPPKLNYRGTLPASDLKLLAVVGSRQYTSYGKAAVDHLIGGLAGYDVGIVSGLAIGIDGLAHEVALRSTLYTLAVPGGGLHDDVLYPARHKRLAWQILDAGGALLSEYEPHQRAARWSFPQRNRIVCGLAHATLVIEAAEQSGSLITARLASDYNRELMVVPGDIFSPMSQGTNQFLKLGATPITQATDIIELLELTQTTTTLRQSAVPPDPESAALLTLLATPLTIDEIVRHTDKPAADTTTRLMQLELQDQIKKIDDRYYRTT